MTHVITNHPYLGVFFLFIETVWCLLTQHYFYHDYQSKIGRVDSGKVKGLHL